jgi:hypothetical protein
VLERLGGGIQALHPRSRNRVGEQVENLLSLLDRLASLLGRLQREFDPTSDNRQRAVRAFAGDLERRLAR